MTQEVPYANVVSKLNLDLSEAKYIVSNLGWGEIPDVHLIEKKGNAVDPKQRWLLKIVTTSRPKEVEVDLRRLLRS